jgi:hypothetical protein
MSQYLIKYICGHEVWTEITSVSSVHSYGRKEKDSKAKAKEKELCPDCQRLKDQEIYRQNSLEDEEAGLPKLVGSEKQVIWADKIRRKCSKFLKEQGEYMEQFVQVAEGRTESFITYMAAVKESLNMTDEEAEEFVPVLIDRAKGMLNDYKQSLITNSAAWWIDKYKDGTGRPEYVLVRFYDGHKKSQ